MDLKSSGQEGSLEDGLGGQKAGEFPRKIKILLVDNHEILRRSLTALLKSQGDMEVVGEAENGEASIRMVRELSPDVVLMDINMEGMNGMEATRIIRSERPATAIIGLSMFDDAEYAEEMLRAGACRYITKSGESEALLRAIRACYRKD
jgi:two-component system response regulator DegU